MKISIILEALTGSFETDMKRASKAAEKAAKQVRDEWKQVGIVLGTAIVAGATALAALTKSSINAAAQMADMAQKVGVSVERLSTLAYAASQSGLSIEQLQGGLVKLAKNASDASQGVGTAVDAFNALGISVKNTDGSLKNTDVLLKEVSEQMARYEDGANKTALAVAIFGRAGAEMIPMLNEGSKGIAEMEQRARDLGVEMDTKTAKAAEHFGDVMEDVGLLAKGFGNDLARELLPMLNQLGEQFVENGIEARKGATGAEVLADSFKVLIAVGYTVKAAIEALVSTIAGYVDIAAAAGNAAAEIAANSNPMTAAIKLASGEFRSFSTIAGEFKTKTAAALISSTTGVADAVDGLSDSYSAIFSVAPPVNEALEDTGEAAKGAAPAIRNMAKETADAAKQAKELEKALREIDKEWEAYAKIIEDVRVEHQKVADAYREQQAHFDAQARDIQNETMLLGLSTAERERAIISLEAERLARDDMGVVIESQRQRYEELLTTLQQAQKIEAAAREFESIWLDAANSVGDALTTALFDGAEEGADAIKDVMENLARDLVRFWLQQNIVIPLQQQLMGGAGGGQGMAGMFGSGGAGGGMNLGNLFSSFGSGNNPIAGVLGQVTGYGQFGTQAGWNAASGSGPPASMAGGASTGAGSIAGNAAGYLAAAYGAWNVYNLSRNGPGGGRGAVSGAAAGASAGFALGSVVPVIGNIVGAVVGGIIGALAGGLGGGDPTIRVSDRESDATATSRLDQVIGVARDRMEPGTATAFANGIAEFDNAIASVLDGYRGGAEQMEEIQSVLENWTIRVEGDAATIENVLTQRFGDILATFDQDVQDFVRNAGTLEEQVQALGEVLVWPEKIADVLNAFRDAEMLAGMSELERQTLAINDQFDQLRVDFEAMNATTEDLAELERFRTIALGELTAATEANTAAIQFAIDAAMDYAATVGDINRQLAELGGASEFQMTLQDIAGALNTNVARLNETAAAAGLLSAREEDLGRAHLLAAAQAAQAMAQLEEAGRALASDLYGSALGDIDAEIARIEAESSGAASAIGDFGNAIREVAATANRATDLLLGDLSPLRDRQKLPLALQAFQQGKIQAEQVLQIGRRLFASGQDYNQLFDQVLAIERTRGGTGMGGGGGGGNFSSSSQSDARLEALLARRAEIEAAQADAARFAQASDLAQIVADLAGARGEDFGTVLGSLSGGRATLDQFAADLGLDNLEALNEYLTALQADSYGIADIAATITAGDRYIVDALRELFEYQMEREAKPDEATDLFTKPLDVPVALPGDNGKPVIVAPPTEPTPGDRIIEERIGGLGDEVRDMRLDMVRLLDMIGQRVGSTGKALEAVAAEGRSRSAAATPRSTRSDLVKPGY